MRPRHTKDFERFVRRFCREAKLEIIERQPGTSHLSITIKTRSGKTVARIVIVGGRKELSPGTLRSILRALGEQLARHAADDLYQLLKRLIDELGRWLQQ
jgi:hypothetical protein